MHCYCADQILLPENLHGRPCKASIDLRIKCKEMYEYTDNTAPQIDSEKHYSDLRIVP